MKKISNLPKVCVAICHYNHQKYLKESIDSILSQTYKDLDIAQYILSLCDNEVELQRVAEELLIYQDRDLFDLLRYLKYLVDVMRENQIIWGVGRGSSVASFILYKLGVHRINSITYKLSINEFLR